MPKSRKRPAKTFINKKIQAVNSRKYVNISKPIYRDKENSNRKDSDRLVSGRDPILTFLKSEVNDEIESPIVILNDDINIPIKLENFDPIEYTGMKQEPTSNYGSLATFSKNNNLDLNIVIEWALNLQFDHSKQCEGRLYPSREIFEDFKCKIVVLYCTVCKKQMLHTLKDWAN